ncbi:MAG: S-adenosylmethionine:tRNA ribosyltransferase-isomerase [Ktedonobacteraceae bacterium]|nr:S-adenosylmethionine:tRNA ribosyltransferase-isomerase [Ktedonobacteraceae bacterium]
MKSVKKIEEHIYERSGLQLATLDFTLPPELEASEPPEARGMERDEVRLMVSYQTDNRVQHTQFNKLGQFLSAGDLLVINTSGTMNAALPAVRADGTQLELHLSTHLPADLWTVEVREMSEKTSRPFHGIQAGEHLRLPHGATVTLHVPYQAEQRYAPDGYAKHIRLWIATLDLPCPYANYLARYGFPIHYGYVQQQWATSYYQTVYVTEVGSAEMPSAGRAFTPRLITQLIAQGVQIAPLLLHTGVASLEEHELPYEEYYRVPVETARLVNATRLAGKRVIAIGTTVVRALETVTDPDGTTYPGEGWTHEIITPQRGIRAVQGLLTGLHEPRATHLAMLAALASSEHLQATYAEALREGYLWHEFGDLHLLLP